MHSSCQKIGKISLARCGIDIIQIFTVKESLILANYYIPSNCWQNSEAVCPIITIMGGKNELDN